MRNWGIVITGFYAVVIVFLLVPMFWLLVGEEPELLRLEWGAWWAWTLVAVAVAGQALLLLLSVDTSRKYLRPRTRIGTSIGMGSLFLGLLTMLLVWSVVVVVMGDDGLPDEVWWVLALPLVLWVAWAVILYVYMRDASNLVTRVTALLLRGSVLELLIAVPAHVWVRRREDCSAPGVTAFGILTGIAIMLMAFGPSVLFLVKKRLDRYR